ncbi:hypothetical protein [Kordia sp.]|uniref:hypothetical protein n=1 Tax=Kordia sp. TaxID=1965332 RepID=UPI003D2E763F
MNNMKLKLFILTLFITLFCKSQEISTTDYTLVNIVVDSLVKQSRKDTIGLSVETLNKKLNEESVLNPGFMLYKNGKFTNECPGNEIKDSLYTKFNYKKFNARPKSWDVKRIENPKVLTDFTLRKKNYINRYNEYLQLYQESDKQEMKEYIWNSERAIPVHNISTPIFSDKKDIGIVLVRRYYNGLQSWQLRKNEKGEWYLFCIKQITYE